MIKTDPDLISLRSNSYEMRESTFANRKTTENKHSPFKASRKILSPSETASVCREEQHDCSQLETQNTVLKVSTRFFFSMFRFAVAHVWGCETMRGRTHYNGARSHCGHCEAAHAALSPTLYDNKLMQVMEKVNSIGYANLTAIDQSYIQTRFALTEEDRHKLSSDDSEIRSSHMRYIVSRLTSQELMGSFINTPLEQARNVTFDNPRAANRVDCHLEHHLRALEDQFAEECREGLKTPKEALQELQLEYRKYLTALEEKLNTDLFHLTSLSECWSRLIEGQIELRALTEEAAFQEKFNSYLLIIEQYLKAYNLRFDHTSEGVPQLKSLQNYLDGYQSYYVLSTLLKGYKKDQDLLKAIRFFKVNAVHLENPSDLQTPFEEARLEVEKRKQETQTQSSVVNETPEDIHKLMKMYFGVRDAEGTFHTPTKQQFAEQFNQSLIALTPTRSDLKAKKRRLKHDSFNDQKQTSFSAKRLFNEPT